MLDVFSARHACGVKLEPRASAGARTDYSDDQTGANSSPKNKSQELFLERGFHIFKNKRIFLKASEFLREWPWSITIAKEDSTSGCGRGTGRAGLRGGREGKGGGRGTSMLTPLSPPTRVSCPRILPSGSTRPWSRGLPPSGATKLAGGTRCDQQQHRRQSVSQSAPFELAKYD